MDAARTTSSVRSLGRDQGVARGPGSPAPGRRAPHCKKSTRLLYLECDQGCAPAAGFERRVFKRSHKRGLEENAAYHFALHADAASMNDAQRHKTTPPRFDEIFLHHGLGISRMKRVQI